MSCPECGSNLGDAGACDAAFRELCGREFSRPALFSVHHLTVHAYTLQHPARYMASEKSTAAHLTGLCWALELGGGPELNRRLSAWLERDPDVRRLEPPPPGTRGSLTVDHVTPHQDAGDYRRAVHEWAASAWEAWSPHHERARAWVKAAMEAPPKRR